MKQLDKILFIAVLAMIVALAMAAPQITNPALAAVTGATGPTSNTGPAIPVNPYAQLKPLSGNQRVDPNQFQLLTNTFPGKNAQAQYYANAPFFYTDAAHYARMNTMPPLDIVRTRTGTYETTHGIQSPDYAGYALGFQNEGKAYEYRNLYSPGPVGVQGLKGYASNPNGNQGFLSGGDNTFGNQCEPIDPADCEKYKGCELVYRRGKQVCAEIGQEITGTPANSLLYNIKKETKFDIKIGMTAKGKANKVFTDIDTRTRLNEMEHLEHAAEQYFFKYFGLNFTDYNTFEGAQMIPFKLSDDIFLQVTDSMLPVDFGIIPERNRVLVDGFMVKPMYGETVVLGGEYAQIKGDVSVFMKESETLVYYEYRIIDEFGHLFKRLQFIVPYPLEINNKGVTGWFACVYGGEDWGYGRDYGVSQIVNYADHEAFTFNNLILFDKEYKFNHHYARGQSAVSAHYGKRDDRSSRAKKPYRGGQRP